MLYSEFYIFFSEGQLRCTSNKVVRQWRWQWLLHEEKFVIGENYCAIPCASWLIDTWEKHDFINVEVLRAVAVSGVFLKSKIVLKFYTLQFFFQTYLVWDIFLLS